MLRRVALTIALCASAAGAAAQTLYVTDSLRLALYESEDLTEKPARARVAELEAELAGLRSENAEYRGSRVNADESAEQLARSVTASKDTADAMHDAVGQLERENASYVARLESFRGSLPLPWVGAALLVALVGGFAAGLWWLDALVRRRHSGFRVY